MLVKNILTRGFGNSWTYRTLSKEAMATHGVFARSVYRNLTPAQLYEIGCNRKPGNPGTEASRISSTGAFCAYSGEKTGRTPKDKRIVQDEITEKVRLLSLKKIGSLVGQSQYANHSRKIRRYGRKSQRLS